MQPDIRRYLQIRGASSPAWLDGGDRLAFVTAITGLPQLWAVAADGGWPDQLTFEAERVTAVLANHDGSRLAFERDRGGNERSGLHLAEPDRPVTHDPDAIHRLGAFAPDGDRLAFCHTGRNGVDFDVAVTDLVTGTRRELARIGGWCQVRDWGPAGILVARARTPFDHDLFLVDPQTGAVRPLTRHTGEVQYGSACLLDDGSVLCACDAGSEFARLALIDDDGPPTFLTPDDADVDEVAVHEARRAWVVNDAGWGRLVVDGEPVEELPEGIPTGLAFSPDGGRLAFALVRPDEPADVWVLHLEGTGPPRRPAARVTRSSRAGLPVDALRAPELRHVTSFDGLDVPFLLYGPAEAPTLLWVHGGPESQERPALNPVIQYFRARGLTVAAPNVRGSTGYGRTYHHLDDVERRLDAVSDLAVLARSLGAERGVPVGVMGGSYGGYMTLAAVTEHPTLWRAAVDVVGIANFVTFLERTGAYRRALREAEYGSLEHDRALLERLSPLRKVDDVRAPLLVIHGANDPRVPVEEAEQIVAAVRARGGVVEYLRYEDEGHGIVRLPNRNDANTRVAAFLERHLLDG